MEDFLYKFLSIYDHLPAFIKLLLGKLYNVMPVRIRYGSFYYIYLKRLRYFNNLENTQAVLAEQHRILFSHINNSIENILYYNSYEKAKSIENFERYPFLNKSKILRSFNDLLNQKQIKKGLKTNTGGSSGTPMEFYLEKGISRSKEKAHFNWYWGQFGYKQNDKILMIRGLPLKNNKLFEYRTLDNVLNVSCYNINKENIKLIAEKINQFKPSFIHAYPSSLKLITSLLIEYKYVFQISLKAIFLGSEHLMDSDREYFEGFYNARVVNWYGHTERLIHGGNCPFSNEFHFYPSYGYIELVDEKNTVITQPGIEGRIVATGFDNNVMPFIRYDTGDLGVLSEVKECKCGFKGVTLSKIIGRGQDVITLSDNTKVSLTAFIFGQHLHSFNKIREIQLIQEKIGQIEMRIVRNSDFSLQDEDSLIDTLVNSVNGKLNIKISYVDTITKTSRGKNIFFVNHLKN